MFVKLTADQPRRCWRTATTSAPSSSWSRAAGRTSTPSAARLRAPPSSPDADTAWISQAALRRWPEVAQDAAWQQALAAMIEKARPHGWIDDARAAIKAHVEWVG